MFLIPQWTEEPIKTEPEVKVVTTEEYIREYFKDIPILIDIARCESKFRQYVDGEVLRGVINSHDVGIMQINEDYHLKESQRLGFNIYTLEGNLGYARYLYDHSGTAPWNWSKKCWNP